MEEHRTALEQLLVQGADVRFSCQSFRLTALMEAILQYVQSLTANQKLTTAERKESIEVIMQYYLARVDVVSP